MKFKKAEMTTQQIVMIIILITSFLVILFFLFRLNLGEDSNSQLCRNSVLNQASALSSSDALNCYREYVCITKDGSCEGLSNPKKKKVKSFDDVYEILAEEMAICWWQWGEGKVDYVGTGPLKNNYCSVCSQVFFDDSLENLEEGTSGEIEDIGQKKISKDRFYNYLANNDYYENVTYAEFIFGNNDIQGLKAGILGAENNTQNVGTFGTIDIGDKDRQYWVVTGITSEIGTTYLWIGGAIAVVAIVSPIGWIATAIIVGSGASIAVAGGKGAELFEPEIGALMVHGEGVPNLFMAPTIIEADSAKFDSLNCEDILGYA